MYTVKFLDDKSFEELPYNRVSTSHGVADRNSGVAYVRDTGNPMDIFTAFHELEHLKGDDLHEYESPGEDGVFYKSFGQGFDNVGKAVMPTLGFALGGPMGSAAGSAMQNFAGGIVNKKGREAAMQKNQPQQATMDQFNPGYSVQADQGPQAPAVSQVGGGAGNGSGGAAGISFGQGTIDKVRQLMNQRQYGFYSGRDAGGM